VEIVRNARPRRCRLTQIALPWVALIVVCQGESLSAQCEALARMPDRGPLWIARQDGAPVRKVTDEWVSMASWSPDGKYVACSYGISALGTKLVDEIGLIASEGIPLSRIQEQSDITNVYETGIGWSRPDVVWRRVTGHASGFVTFRQVPPALDLNRSKVLGVGWGDYCAPSPDLTEIACVEAGHVSVVKVGDNLPSPSSIVYPPTALIPANRRGSLELELGQTGETRTDPVFHVRVFRGTRPMEGRVVLEVTPPGGYPAGVYLTGADDELPVDLEDADWHFVLHALDSARTRFRITAYEDDNKRKLTGMAWGVDGSSLLTWEETRHGTGALLLVRAGGAWSSKRFSISIPTPVLRVRFGSADSTALVETPGAIHRCGLDDRAACTVVASHPPARLNVRLGGSVVVTDVLDWRCPLGGN